MCLRDLIVARLSRSPSSWKLLFVNTSVSRDGRLSSKCSATRLKMKADQSYQTTLHHQHILIKFIKRNGLNLYFQECIIPILTQFCCCWEVNILICVEVGNHLTFWSHYLTYQLCQTDPKNDSIHLNKISILHILLLYKLCMISSPPPHLNL